MRILYAIMAYGPTIIASEVHSELGQYFREQGHTFSVFSLEDYNDADAGGANPFPDEVDAVKVYALKFKNSRWRKFLRRGCSYVFKYGFFLELLWGYYRFLKKHKDEFDIIHVENAYPLGTVAALTSLLIKKPFVVNLQGADVMSIPEYDYGYGRYRVPRLLLRFTFWRVPAVRANSEQTAELAKHYGAKASKVKVILRNISRNIYPPTNFNIVENKQRQQIELRQRYNLNVGPILISYSRLHPFKGVDWLIKAIPLLQKQFGPISLLVCGPSRRTPQFGDYRTYLENLAKELGVADSVIFTGKIDFAHSQDYLAGADLLVIPSIADALNKVAIEAAAVGTPVVMTDTTGIAPHSVKAGVGLSVPPCNPEALADGITKALNNREAMGKNGPAFAQAFTGPCIGDQLLNLYHQVLNVPYDNQPVSALEVQPKEIVKDGSTF